MAPRCSNKRKAAASPAAAPASKKTKSQATPETAAKNPKTARGRLHKPHADTPDAATPAQNYIDALPDELLLCVLEHLDVQLMAVPRLQMFKHLSLTSRRLAQLSNNFLYRDFNANDTRHPGKFVRTIIGNSDLASRVKTMAWDLGTFKPFHLFTPSSADKRILRESLKQLQIADRSSWVEKYSVFRFSNLCEIALLHTPNLRRLIIHNEPVMRDLSLGNDRPIQPIESNSNTVGHMQLLKDAALGTPKGLSPVYAHLHSIHVCMGQVQLATVLPLFRLPSLRRLSLAGLNSSQSLSTDYLSSVLPEDSSSVNDLALRNSCLYSADLSQIIAGCRELNNFIYVYNHPPYQPVVPDISYPALKTALEKHKNTLEILDVDDESVSSDIIEPNNRGHIGSFKDFKNLICLGIPMEAFEALKEPPPDFSADVDVVAGLGELLPHGLHRLSLTIFDQEEENQYCSSSLLLLHHEYRKYIPHLVSVEVKGHKLVYMKFVDFSLPRLHFSADGISFSITQEGTDVFDLDYSSDEDSLAGFDASDLDSLDHEILHDMFDYGFSDGEIDFYEEEDFMDAMADMEEETGEQFWGAMTPHF